MLVLTRKTGEAIVAGDVVIRVLSIGATRVKLAIEAPASVHVYRAETPNAKSTKGSK
jgi:carbon storage regulator CsrA